MSIDEIKRVDALAPLGGAAAPATSAPADDSASFRRLLESLERLKAEHRQTPEVADAVSVQDAVARVDEGFSLAMDLRRQLEIAFRQRMP